MQFVLSNFFKVNPLMEKRETGSDEEDSLAIFANAVYKTDSKLPDDYKVLEDFGDVKVYGNGKRVIISHRGTQVTNTTDIVSDINLVTGNITEDKQFKRRLAITREMVEKYKDAGKISLTGHSLGATTAIYALNDPVVNQTVESVKAYNPGTFSRALAPPFFGNEEKITTIKTPGDPISKNYSPGGVFYGKPRNNIRIPIFPKFDFIFGLTNHTIRK